MVTWLPVMSFSGWSLAATKAEGMPWTPSRSVRARAGSSSSTARATSSSGAEAPSRKEKWDLHQRAGGMG